jgi:hypothetical protein
MVLRPPPGLAAVPDLMTGEVPQVVAVDLEANDLHPAEFARRIAGIGHPNQTRRPCRRISGKRRIGPCQTPVTLSMDSLHRYAAFVKLLPLSGKTLQMDRQPFVPSRTMQHE